MKITSSTSVLIFWRNPYARTLIIRKTCGNICSPQYFFMKFGGTVSKHYVNLKLRGHQK